jgi:broad specificity phosphatase PhoE
MNTMEKEPSFEEIGEKEIENNSNPEKKRFGRDVEIHIMLVRHADRPLGQTAPNVRLTDSGINKCAGFGSNLREKDRIEGACSPTFRTKATVDLIIGNSPTKNKLRPQEKQELASRSSPAFVKKIQEHVKESLMKKNGKVPPDLELCSTVEGIDFYLSFGDKRPDAQTYSPVEAAANVAQILDTTIRKANLLRSATDMDAVFSSHDYVIAAFLKEVMLRETKDGQIIRGFASLAELGDTIDFLEGPEIIVKNDQNGKQSIGLAFRQKKYALDMKRFRELVKIGTRLKEEIKNNSNSKNHKTDEEILRNELNKKLGIGL